MSVRLWLVASAVWSLGLTPLARADNKAAANRQAVEQKLQSAARLRPYGRRDQHGHRLTAKRAKELDAIFRAKLRAANRSGGVVLTGDQRLIPAGESAERVRVRRKSWTPRRPSPTPATDTKRTLRATRTSRAVVDRALRNVALGLPSRGRRRGVDEIFVRSDRVFSYNREKNLVNWVSWRVSANDMRTDSPQGGVTSSGRPRQSGVKRINDMRADHSLPRGIYRPAPIDYYGSGFDPGHLVASADRSGNQRDQRRTNVYTNMVPQAANNNRGPWLAFERIIQDHAREGWTVHVIAGGAFRSGARVIGNGVAVPDSTWKVAVFVPPGGSVDKDGRVYAIDVPNSNTTVARTDPLTKYRAKPAEIEARTGLRFFSGLPDARATELRNSQDASLLEGRKLVAPSFD